MNLGEDGEGDFLRGLSADIEADRGVEAGELGGGGRGLAFLEQSGEEIVRAGAGAEHADVARRGGDEETEEVEIVKEIVGHHDAGGAGVDLEVGETLGGDVMGGEVREAVRVGRAEIDDPDLPAEGGGDGGEGDCIGAGAEDPKRGRGLEGLDEGAGAVDFGDAWVIGGGGLSGEGTEAGAIEESGDGVSIGEPIEGGYGLEEDAYVAAAAEAEAPYDVAGARGIVGEKAGFGGGHRLASGAPEVWIDAAAADDTGAQAAGSKEHARAGAAIR